MTKEKKIDYSKFSKETVVGIDLANGSSDYSADSKTNLPIAEEKTNILSEAEMYEPVMGTVINCARMNIREEPNITSAILGVVNVGTELQIEPLSEKEWGTNSTEWMHILTSAGIDGYVLTEYIKV